MTVWKAKASDVQLVATNDFKRAALFLPGRPRGAESI